MTEDIEIDMDAIKSQIFELYTEIKESISLLNSKREIENIESDTVITSTTKLSLIIKILRHYIKLLIKQKSATINNNENNIIINQLKSYIVKLENDIRYCLKKIFMFKNQKDSLETKIRGYMQIEDEYEELKVKVRYDDGKFLENDRKDNEIIILRRENSILKKEITNLEERNKELVQFEKKYNDSEIIINEFKNKNEQLNIKLKELEEELHNIKHNNNNITINGNISNFDNDLNSINNNKYSNRKILEYYNMTSGKNKLDKFNKKNKSNIHLKHGITNYQLANSPYNFESTKNNHSRITLKTNGNNSKFIISSYNKIYNTKNIITSLRNNICKNLKKVKSNSVSMRDENDKSSDLMIKYLSGNNSINKYPFHIKTRSLNKLSKKIPEYILPLSSNSIGKKYLNKEGPNPYEHSALNKFGMNKKI